MNERDRVEDQTVGLRMDDPMEDVRLASRSYRRLSVRDSGPHSPICCAAVSNEIKMSNVNKLAC